MEVNKEDNTDNARDESWVSPLEKMIGLVDEKNGLVQIYEYHARGSCRGASAWVAYHYPRTSSIVVSAEMDGARNIFTMELGQGELYLRPSISPAGIESVSLRDGQLVLTYAGLAGAGVGISRCRAKAANISRVNIMEPGGGSTLGRAEFTLPAMHKIHIGIDDTDSADTGATWSLTNEIGWHASNIEGVEYLNHTLVQLYPLTPGKTKNCVSTVLTFGVIPDRTRRLLDFIMGELKSNTASDDTGMAVYEGIVIPPPLREFADRCRTRVVTLDEAVSAAAEAGAGLIEVTGSPGIIGALAAIGYAEHHNEAVKLPKGYEE